MLEPSVFAVGGVQESVTPPLLLLEATGAAFTAIENAGNLVVAVPSLTEMTMLANVPVAVGLPDSWPVLVLKVAHEGRFVIEKPSVLPSASLAVGVKL